MRSTFAGLLLPVLLVAACSSAGDGGSSARPSEPDEGMVLPSPTKDLGGGAAQPGRELTGELGFDDIEGGCAYLQTGDGKRYEVLYPDGWHVDMATASLVGPAGEQVKAGGTVTVVGSIATDRSSICQLGPIFQATEVRIEA